MKRVLSLVLSIIIIVSVICVGTVSSSARANTMLVLVGDADGSGDVDILDATVVQRYLAKLSDLTDVCKISADADGDGVISITDATTIQRYLASLLNGSNIGKYVSYYSIGTDPSEYETKSEYKGIDVSRWQGDIDWKKVKAAGIDFAMIRLGYGSEKGTNCKTDIYFEQNVRNAVAAGVDIGCYFYSYAMTAEAAKKEAQFVVSVLDNYKGVFTYPIAFDLEDNSQVPLGKTVLTNMVLEFGNTIEDAGYYCSLYSNLSWLYNILDDSQLKKFDHWLAQWSAQPTYKGSFGMWQYSATGRVNGINGDVDLDIAYYNYPKIIRNANLNGFTGGPVKEPVVPVGCSGDIPEEVPSTNCDVTENINLLCYDDTPTMMNSIRHAILTDSCGAYMQDK